MCVQANFEEKKNDDGVEYGDEKHIQRQRRIPQNRYKLDRFFAV